jgi:hypothetical protein
LVLDATSQLCLTGGPHALDNCAGPPRMPCRQPGCDPHADGRWQRNGS